MKFAVVAGLALVCVAPHAGAGIEIVLSADVAKVMSRPPRGGGN